MSNIQVAYTDQGPLMGDFELVNTSKGVEYAVTNPVILQQMGQQLGMIPILGFTKSKTLTLSKSEIKYGGEVFDPQDDLRNHYNSQFGSGIVLATAPASIAKK